MEWELVAIWHSSIFTDLECTGDKPKKKFNELAKTRSPMSDSTIPEESRKMKDIRKLIFEKTDSATGPEDELFSLADMVNENEEDMNFEEQLESKEVREGKKRGSRKSKQSTMHQGKSYFWYHLFCLLPISFLCSL
jgi:hypothetical protein